MTPQIEDVSRDIISLYRAKLAKEKGTTRKDWGGRVSIALGYPNYYRLGMSNLGLQIVYRLLNSRQDAVAERFFLPEGQEMSLYLQTGKPLLSLESQTPLQRFNLVAFSLSFENDYPNILRLLHMGKIPLLSQQRDESHPFVMAGGVTTFLNPEPLAPFFDFFLLGEAEVVLDDFVALFADIIHTPHRRSEHLKTLARNMRSVYVPSLYHVGYRSDGTIRAMEPTEKNLPEKISVACQSLTQGQVNTSTLLTPETELGDRVLVELGRGCGRSCRFCAAGYVYRPPRVHAEDRLLSSMEDIMGRHGRIGLLSASVSDTPGLERLTASIIQKGGDFSVSSLRADSLTQDLLDHLKQAGQRTVAIAPEAGSERLRRVMNKHLTRDQIMDAATLISRVGNFILRLYFLIGLPTETRDDVAQVVDLVKGIKHHMVKEAALRGTIGQIKLSVNCFVPKPFTPFQWFALEPVTALKEKQKWLKKALSKEGGITVNTDLPKWAYVQTLLAMGDRRAASILLLVHTYHGDWTRAFRSSELNPDFFVYRPRGFDEILPWDFIDHGISKSYLIKEYRLALKEQESDVCHVGECERCGVCHP